MNMSRQTNIKRRSSTNVQLDRINTIAKRVTKTGNRKVLTELCRKIDLAKTRSGNGKIPYGFVTNIIRETKEVCSWVSRDKVMNHYRSHHYDKFQKKKQEVVLLNQVLPPLHREKGGRPLGLTDDKKRCIEMAVIAAKNEIAILIAEEMNNKKKGETDEERLHIDYN